MEAIETIEPTQIENAVSDEWALTMFTCTPGGKTRVVVHCSAITDNSYAMSFREDCYIDGEKHLKY